jgi:hypothetical protein
MKRISFDYSAVTEDICRVCGRAILPGMTVYNVVLKSGKKAVIHSLCERKEVKKK